MTAFPYRVAVLHSFRGGPEQTGYSYHPSYRQAVQAAKVDPPLNYPRSVIKRVTIERADPITDWIDPKLVVEVIPIRAAQAAEGVPSDGE